MGTATISIQVDEKAAQAFATATAEEQGKIELLSTSAYNTSRPVIVGL